MRAAWYETQGPPADTLCVGEMSDTEPGPGELRFRVRASGVNPGDVKKRQDTFGVGMPYPRVVPHSDGAGIVDQVGIGVDPGSVGRRVWCFGAQSYRPFGTAAELCVVPQAQVTELADQVSFEQGALLGIAGLIAHCAVHAGGPIDGRTLVVQGGAGAVGSCAVRLAVRARATVIATVRNADQVGLAQDAGADHVLLSNDELVAHVAELAPDGVDHIVEVAFGANVARDVQMLKIGGSIAAYASLDADPSVPFWPMVFKNLRVFFLGSDDVSLVSKREAATSLTEAAAEQWIGLPVGARFPLDSIADAHEAVERRTTAGRVVVGL